jgi:hypothetical protein
MFIGCALMGILYERSIGLLITFSVIIEILAVIIFFIMKKEVLKASAG